MSNLRDRNRARRMRNGKILDLRFDQGQIGQGNAVVALSRASADTIFDALLDLQELPNAIPAIMHDPVASASRGLQVPRPSVNEARNNRAAGATNGVIGSGGVAPTDWVLSAGGTGLSIEVIGTDTEDGLPYCDVRFFGTASSGEVGIVQITSTTAAALQDEIWTHSSYTRLVGGDLTNVTNPRVQIHERDAAGAFLVSSETVFTLTDDALKTQRRLHTRTLTDGSTAFVLQRLALNCAAGAVDFTIRLAGADLEEVPFATPLILTDAGGSSARAVTDATTALSGVPGFDETALIWRIAGRTPAGIGSTETQIIGQIDDGSGNNRHWIRRQGTDSRVVCGTIAGSVSQATLTLGVLADDTDFAVAFRPQANNFFAAMNIGGTITTDSEGAGTMPGGLITKRVGVGVAGNEWGGTIDRDTMWAGGGSDEFVRQLVRLAA